MVTYLTNRKLPENKKIWKQIEKEKEEFRIERDSATDMPWLYRKMKDNVVFWLEPEFQSGFVEKINTKYRYLG